MRGISIIMPVFNSERYLRDALDSVLSQSYSEWEFIAVNDGATDNSLQILNEYAGMDDRIRIIDQKNSGPSCARNAGIDSARKEWIYFMDSDDVMDRDMIKGLMEASDGYEMVICGFIKHFTGSEKHDRTFSLLQTSINSYDDFQRFLSSIIKDDNKDAFFNCIWNRIFSTEIIKTHNLRFDETVNLGEDFLFITDYLKICNSVRIIEGIYYHYYVRGRASLVGRFIPNELERRIKMYSAMKNLYEHYNAYSDNRHLLEINEGRYSWKVIRKINYSTCTISKHEKIEYINGFMRNERKEYMVYYLSTKKGLKNRIKELLIKSQNPGLLYLCIDKCMRKG